MKVKIKSVLKSSSNSIDCFEEQQIISRAGNTLCIKEIGKNQSQFICLNPSLTQLYTFKPTTNRKGVFTVQRIQSTVQVAHYSLKGARKSIPLVLQPSFVAQIERVDSLVDEYDNNILYCGLKSKETACICLVDISKMRVLAMGYMSGYEDIKLDFRQNLSLSVLSHNSNHNVLKSLRYVSGQWQIVEQQYKKIQGIALQHELLACGRVVFITRNNLYHFEGSELLQTLEMRDGSKIRQILKIHRGLLMVGQDSTVQVLIEDNDEVTLLSKGTLRLQLQQKDQINRIFLSYNGDQVIIGTKNNNIYSWKCQYIDLQPNHFDFSFSKVQSSCSSSHKGSISLSTGRKYCMLAGDRNVTLWSVQKNQYVLSSQFVSALEQKKKKSVLCCAVNPDGNSFMMAFQDRVRVYRILLTKFKFQTQFAIKKCLNIVYSQGGQLTACRFGRGTNSCLKIINNLRMVEVEQIKLGAQPTQIIWNMLDDQILMSSDTNTVQIFSVSQTTKKGIHCLQSKINLIRIDYKSKRLMISCDKKIIVADTQNIIDQYQPPFSDFHYIFPLYGVYFIATKGGMLHWSPSTRFEQYQSFSLFSQTPFSLICRSGYLLAYSSFQDIMILNCIREGKEKGQTGDEIVMVERDEILQFYDKVKWLQNNFEMMQSATQIRLQQQKANYESALRKFKSEFKGQISNVNVSLNEMAGNKLKQQRQNEKVFEKLQQGQARNVDTIEKMYQRKCKMLQQSLLNLQQSHIEQKKHYQDLLLQLQQRYNGDIVKVRQRFEDRMREEYMRADEVKLNVLQDKKRLQFKLVELQEQNQVTLQDMQINKDDIITKLRGRIDRLQSQLQGQQIKKESVLILHQKLLSENQQKVREYEILNTKYQQSLNRIRLLQKQVQSKKQTVEQKQRTIIELVHQVGGLQKAKYVLSFRTNEIRKQLQPKQQLADRLKNELQKVDEQYKQQKKKNFELCQKLQKSNKLTETTKKNLFDTKQALKLKESKHLQLLNRINYIVTEVRQKQWGDKLRQLNQRYSKDRQVKDQGEKKKRDPSQQLNRHLKHVQLSLQHVANSNDKILRGKDKDIARRMRQNSQLMFEINVKKKNQILLKKANQELKEEKEVLQKQFDQNFQTKRNSTRAQTSMTKRRAVSRDEIRSRDKSFAINRESSREKEMKDILKERSKVDSTHKTLMYRDETREKNSKFFYIARQLQSARNTIKVQEQMLEQLNKQVFIQQNQGNN